MLCVLFAACAGAPVAQRPEPFFGDHLFAAPEERVSAADVFAMSDAMQRYADADMTDELRAKGLHKGLIDALYSNNQLRLQYDSAFTRNAAQAFAARSGNCLSLVIMTAAFAKRLGLSIEYHSAFIDPVWSRSGNLHFLSGHVNLTVGKRSTDPRTPFDVGRLMTIDFLPQEELRGLRTHVITEETIVAMFMNNRAAEALAAGRLNDAYWWAREAIVQAPDFLSAYNTLGVVFLRHGDLPQAERILGHVLAQEPRNPQALSNLAVVLQKLGRAAESGALQNRLAQVEPYPPFHFFDRGLTAMRAGRYTDARDLFAREIERAPHHHELHFWLGMSALRLGDLAAARRHLAQAMENSTTGTDRNQYAAKLELIRSPRAP